MSLRKLWMATAAACVLAGTVLADPVRTLFTRENKFPGAMKTEVWVGGSGSSYEGSIPAEDVDAYALFLGARFGLTDRVAVHADIPYAFLSAGDDIDESGVGDMSIGADFLFFEDIFGYAWIVPHATVFLPTGDEDKWLGRGKTQAKVGLSAGTTVENVVHFAVDASYTSNASYVEEDDGLFTGGLSIVWDLDERASLLGEVQVLDESVDPDDSYSLRGHLGLVYRINKGFSVMAYGGSSTGLDEDFYGAGRLVYQF